MQVKTYKIGERLRLSSVLEGEDLIDFKTKLKLEVHLMIEGPEKSIEDWLIKPVDRVIFHQEATKSHELLIDKIHEAKKEAGLAIKPDTPWLKLFPYIGKVELFQLLAVNPGPSGQEFQEEILHKLGHMRQVCPECIIEVDGGVNKEVARACAKEGADLFVAGQVVFGSSDIEKAIKELKNGIK